MKLFTLLTAMSVLMSAPAFAVSTTVCKGKFSKYGSATLTLTTAEDDVEEGSLSILLFSGNNMSMPIHRVLTVVMTQNHDSDADVSRIYVNKDKAGTKIRFKLNDNPAVGASYIAGLPNLNKIALSCNEVPKI